jgi:ELWxxDGT repeat protein
MVAYNNKVYFPAQDAGSNGEELWVSDGTAAGTKMVKDLTPYLAHHSSSPKHLVVFGDKLYMRATDTGYASMIWQTDGTTAGTKQITYPLTNVSKISYTDWLRLRLSTLAPVGDKLYFWNLYNSTESFSLYTLNMFPDGIKHAGINGKLELSPNPVNDYLYFSKELKNISLYTMNGSLVDKKGQATRIETAQLLPGTYIIQADEDGSQKQGVFIKQ